MLIFFYKQLIMQKNKNKGEFQKRQKNADLKNSLKNRRAKKNFARTEKDFRKT